MGNTLLALRGGGGGVSRYELDYTRIGFTLTVVVR